MQKEIREEMERLRTQYTFKVCRYVFKMRSILTQFPQQHEMETSIRKPPWSARSRRTATEAPPTPLAIPAQMHHWNTQRDRAAGPSKGEEEIPGGPRFGTITKGSPKTIRNHKTTATPAAKKSAKLGFYNSFDISTPVRPSQTMTAKARNGRGVVPDGTIDWMGKAPSLFGQRTGRSSAGIPPSPPSSPTRGGRAASDVDMQSDDYAAFPASDSNAGFEHGNMGMIDVDMGYENVEDGLSEELEEIEGLNWEDEVSGFYLITLQSPIHSGCRQLHRILLTHESVSSTSRTFQVLMKAHSDTSMSGLPAELYAKACTRILEVLAAHSTTRDWEAALFTLSTSLTDMADLLNTTVTVGNDRPLS